MTRLIQTMVPAVKKILGRRAILGLAAAAVVVGSWGMTPGLALARDHGRDEHDRGEGRGRVSVEVRHEEFRIGIGQRQWVPGRFEDRPVQVWVEPTYRTVYERVWTEPVYRTASDRVWTEPVVQRVMERAWVPDRYEVREVTYFDGRVRRTIRQDVLVERAHWEDRSRDVVVTPGRWDNVERRELVSPGGWQNVERQEVVCPGHWETRIQRVEVCPGHWEDRPMIRIGW